MLHNGRGITYFLQGDISQAARSFKKALDLDPCDEGLQGNLDMALSKLGRERRMTLASEIGVRLPGDLKAEEGEVAAEYFQLEVSRPKKPSA